MEQEKLNNGCLYLYKKGPPEEVLTVDVIKDIYKTEVIIREDPVSSRSYINSHLKLTPFSPLKIDPLQEKIQGLHHGFMMEEKGDDFYGGVGNYQVFKGKGKIYKGHCRELGISKNTVKRALRANKPPHYQRPPRDNPQLVKLKE